MKIIFYICLTTVIVRIKSNRKTCAESTSKKTDTYWAPDRHHLPSPIVDTIVLTDSELSRGHKEGEVMHPSWTSYSISPLLGTGGWWETSHQMIHVTEWPITRVGIHWLFKGLLFGRGSTASWPNSGERSQQEMPASLLASPLMWWKQDKLALALLSLSFFHL